MPKRKAGPSSPDTSNALMKKCLESVGRTKIRMNHGDLLIILGEVQRRTGHEIVCGGCSEGSLHFHARPFPRRWRPKPPGKPYFWFELRGDKRSVLEPSTFELGMLNEILSEDTNGASKLWSASVNTHALEYSDCWPCILASQSACIVSEEFAAVADEMIDVVLHRGLHYAWDRESWEIYLDAARARRKSVWFEAHVWPSALAYYHLLTRRGLDAHCAAVQMARWVGAPLAQTYAPSEPKKYGNVTISVR